MWASFALLLLLVAASTDAYNSPPQTPATEIMILVESSKLMGAANFARAKNYAESFINALNVGSSNDRVAMASFATSMSARYVEGPSMRKDFVASQVRYLVNYGGSDLSLKYTLSNSQSLLYSRIHRGYTPAVLVILGSGRKGGSDKDSDITAQINWWWARGVKVYYVSAGTIDRTAIGKFVLPQNIFEMSRTSVNTIVGSIRKDVACGSNKISQSGRCTAFNPCALQVCAGNARCATSGLGFTCQCESGFIYQADYGCQAKKYLDLAFIIDVSSAVSTSSMQKTKSFIKGLLDGFYVTSSYVRVCIVMYNSQVPLILYFNQGANRYGLDQIIDKMTQYRGGNSNALTYVLQNIESLVFNPRRGSRTSVPHVAYLFTSGSISSTQLVEFKLQLFNLYKLGITMPVLTTGSTRLSTEVTRVFSMFVPVIDLYRVTNINVVITRYITTTVQGTACQKGTAPDSRGVCQDINECTQFLGICGEGSTCTNTRNSYSCSCRGSGRSYVSGQGCLVRTVMDLVIALDNSNKVSGSEFNANKLAALDLVKSLDVSASYVRVLIAAYSDYLYTYLTLTATQKREDAVNAITRVPYRGTAINFYSALYNIGQTAFRGARRNANRVVLFMGSGQVEYNHDSNIIQLGHQMLGQSINMIMVGGRSISPVISKFVFAENIMKLTTSTGIVSTILTKIIDSVSCSRGQYRVGSTCKTFNICSLQGLCGGGSACQATSAGAYTCKCGTDFQYGGAELGCQASTQLDIVFLVDISDSLGRTNLEKAKEFLRDFVKSSYIASNYIRVAILGYSERNLRMYQLLRSRQSSQFSLAVVNQMSIYPGAPGNLLYGLQQALEQFKPQNGARSNVPKTLYLISSGVIDVNSMPQIRIELSRLHNIGIRVPVTTVGTNVNINIMREIAFPFGVVDITRTTSTQITKIVIDIVTTVVKNAKCAKGQYSKGGRCVDIDECVRKPCPRGAKCTNIVGSYKCSCAEGLKLTTDGCLALQLLDIVFVVDVSPSQGQANLNRAKKFMVDYVNGLVIGKEGANVGIIGYSHEPFVASWLVDSRDYVLKAINQLKISGGNPSDLSKALPYLNERVLSPGRTRRGAKKLAILLTAGTIPQTQITFIRTQMDILRQLNINVPVVPVVPSTVTIDFSIFKQITLPSLIIDIKTVIDSKNPIEIITNVIINIIKQTDCKKGYVFDGKVCVDFNECELPKTCAHGATCKNTDGGYTCVCKRGFRYESTGCVDIDECRTNPCKQGATCENTKGARKCNCKNGYTYSESKGCIDIDECRTNPCKQGAVCENTAGAHKCNCKNGFTYDDIKGCIDIDECRTNPCKQGATCENTEGAHKCNCKNGFDYDEIKGCIDIDECQLEPSPCLFNGSCKNTPGSYMCVCAIGYIYDASTGCQDFNECHAPSGPSPCKGYSVKCSNTIGSFRCSCNVGYVYDGDTEAGCVDIDECNVGKPCKEGATCQNVRGSFKCNCKTGHKYNQVKGCVDIDECLTNPCKQGATCNNTAGAHKCNCKNGFTYDDIKGCLATRKLDVVFVVEVSSNVKEIELKRFKEVITETIEQFHIHKDYVRVGLMTYAASPKSVVFLSDFKSQDEFSLAVKSLELDGSTPDVVNALVFLKDQMLSMITGARENVSKEVFYLTSGKVPKTQIDKVQIFIRQIHEINIGINTITTGKDFDLEFVQTLSFPRTVHTIFDIKNLYIFLSTIIVNVVGQTSCDSGNQFKDGKCVDIDECLNKFACGVHATCSNKPGTYVCTCPKGYRHDVSRGCIAEKCMDVVFLVDGSDTMGKVEYTKALDFIQSFVRGLAIGPEDVRVAIAVAYGTKVMGLLKLNKYQSYEGVMAVLSQLKFPGGEQNLVWALDKLHSGILVKENGAREDTPRMLFLLTNGKILASQTEIAVEIEHLRAANVRTFTILTSPQSPPTEVIKILSFPFGAITIEEIKLSIFKFTTNIVVGLSCTQGYHPENGHCVDDNECLMPKICAADSRCENRPGSFVCKCIQGYVYNAERGCLGDVKMDLAIVVENSDRMTAKSMVATKALIKGLINNVAIDAEHVHVALANIFGASFMTNLRLNSTQSWEQFVAATESIEFKGTPNTDVALQVERSYDLLLAEGVGGRKNVMLKTIILVLADSLSGEAAEDFQAALQKYRKLGIRVIDVYVNLYSPSNKPQSDVEMPAGSFVISDIKFVERFAIAIVKSILGDSKCKHGYHMFQGKCQDIDECQFLGICRGGAQCHNIKASYKCSCREGFSYDTLVGCVIDGKLDLVFAVDGSDDMGTANFDKAKKLMADVVRHMRLGPDSINFVIVVYNQENTFSIVQAQQGSSNALSAQAVQKIKYPGGKPDLITVLNGLKQHVFVAKYGMRVGVAKAVLVLSSGSFTDKTKTATAAMEVQQSGVLVYSVILNEKKYTDCSGMFYGGFTFKLTTFSIHTFLTRVVANSLCKNGFKSVNGKCVDIDECQLDGLCETGSTCQNIAGSYECTCPAGYSYEKGQGCSKSSYIGIGGGTVVTTCKMNGKTYQLGSQWVEDCVTYVCAGAAGPVSIGIKCRGSDGKCYGLGVDHPFFDPNAKKEVTCSCAQTPKGIKRSCRTAKK